MPSRSLYRFYAAEVSYFSGKVRPALRYKQLPYAEILPTPEVYRTVIEPRTGLRFIPVVVTPDDETLQDTSVILDRLEQLHPDPPLYPAGPKQLVAALLWELYADEFLVVPALHYRWGKAESAEKAKADFAAVSGDPESARKFAERISGMRPFIGLTDETEPAFEAHTLDLLDRLEAHFAAHPYLLGGRPSLADCSLMGPMYAHLYLDAAPGRILRQRAPRVCHWIERMNHPDPDADGDWLPADALAPTMESLLELIGRDAVPMILDTVESFESWADTRPAGSAELPRGVGAHETKVRGVVCQRYTSPYTLWMVQRPLDAYAALDPVGRTAVDAALAGSGCDRLFQYRPRHRVGKRRFQLVIY